MTKKEYKIHNNRGEENGLPIERDSMKADNSIQTQILNILEEIFRQHKNMKSSASRQSVFKEIQGFLDERGNKTYFAVLMSSQVDIIHYLTSYLAPSKPKLLVKISLFLWVDDNMQALLNSIHELSQGMKVAA